MKFEWDNNKNLANIEKHGIGFEYAKQLFDNDLMVVPDLRYNYEEIVLLVMASLMVD